MKIRFFVESNEEKYKQILSYIENHNDEFEEVTPKWGLETDDFYSYSYFYNPMSCCVGITEWRNKDLTFSLARFDLVGNYETQLKDLELKLRG